MLKSLFACMALVGLFASCSENLHDKLLVSVSIDPLRYFVESVGGDRCQVNTLVPSGVSPETYEPTPKQVVEVNESAVYCTIGTLGFEHTRLQQLTHNNPRLLIVNVSDSIAPLLTEGDCCKTDGHHHADGMDLHTWPSTTSGRRIAKNVLKALCAADSMNAATYIARHDSLVRHIDTIETQVREQLKDLEHRTFLIYHPALGYFARDFGLRQISVEQDGKEPSVERMQQLIRQSRAEGVKVVFVQEEHAGRAARRIAEAIGGRVVSIAPLSRDWDKQLLHIARSLAE
ncbi:zinc ABC transporter substrate-binding protein [Alloprevotella sp. OH1205_COT-284]|uniref:metal ABC transporter solute-binding protein, Zn/Mn family n=1 Tax=Alloprevotella sp. OH1205_COT-284 TaxID=2491043 RepID=UPI000F5F57EB|nr:zinc ABC transporter substrate-binding protein [Alloprevotella sp. OH1205_COT-284]RRD80864.1 zinc ABC transporter substrate-binding protein [Alloprevotella sp. OH1205_COT-284]